MKTLKLIGVILLFLLGTGMLFTATIMCDLKTTFEATAYTLGFLGVMIMIGSFFLFMLVGEFI